MGPRRGGARSVDEAGRDDAPDVPLDIDDAGEEPGDAAPRAGGGDDGPSGGGDDGVSGGVDDEMDNGAGGPGASGVDPADDDDQPSGGSPGDVRDD